MKLKIKELREELRMTQSELAEKIDTLQRNVSNWENGVSEPDCATILRLAEVFEVSVDELFGREDFVPKTQPQTSSGDKQILAIVHGMTDTQKFALLQFLREMCY